MEMKQPCVKLWNCSRGSFLPKDFGCHARINMPRWADDANGKDSCKRRRKSCQGLGCLVCVGLGTRTSLIGAGSAQPSALSEIRSTTHCTEQNPQEYWARHSFTSFWNDALSGIFFPERAYLVQITHPKPTVFGSWLHVTVILSGSSMRCAIGCWPVEDF